MPSITWKRLAVPSDASSAVALKRSSNSLAIVGDKAYLFGGEAVPRTPVDDELYVIDLSSMWDYVGHLQRILYQCLL
jgi:hypothetical protein